MNVEVLEKVIDKLISNLVIPDLEAKIDYDLRYYDHYKKFFLEVTVYVDVRKMFQGFKTYDPEYMNDIYELEDNVDGIAKYTGMGMDKMSINVYVEYLNDEFVDDEAIRLENKLINRLVSEKGVDRDVLNNFWVAVHKTEETSPHFKLEVGMSDTTKLTESGISIDDIENMLHEELKTPDNFPALHDMYLDDVDYWWDY
jgi:hypothetical protein